MIIQGAAKDIQITFGQNMEDAANVKVCLVDDGKTVTKTFLGDDVVIVKNNITVSLTPNMTKTLPVGPVRFEVFYELGGVLKSHNVLDEYVERRRSV